MSEPIDSDVYQTWDGKETVGVARGDADPLSLPIGLWAIGDKIWMTCASSGTAIQLASEPRTRSVQVSPQGTVLQDSSQGPEPEGQDGAEAAAYFVRRLRSFVNGCLGQGPIAQRAESLLEECREDDSTLLDRAVAHAHREGKILGVWVAEVVKRELDRVGSPAPVSVRKVLLIVAGEKIEMSAPSNYSMHAVKEKALTESKNTLRPPDDWQIRDVEGRLVDGGFRVDAFPDGTKFFISLPVGWGG